MSVVISMLFALSGAGLTHIGAELHILLHKLRATRFKPSAKGADIGAIAAELNAGSHVVMHTVLFAHLNTGRCTAFAGFGAFKTGVGVAVGMGGRSHNVCCFRR
jgi:hypothetical protein